MSVHFGVDQAPRVARSRHRVICVAERLGTGFIPSPAKTTTNIQNKDQSHHGSRLTPQSILTPCFNKEIYILHHNTLYKPFYFTGYTTTKLVQLSTLYTRYHISPHSGEITPIKTDRSRPLLARAGDVRVFVVGNAGSVVRGSRAPDFHGPLPGSNEAPRRPSVSIRQDVVVPSQRLLNSQLPLVPRWLLLTSWRSR